MTSRLNLAAPAVRPALKARLMLAAPSGGGKTKTGLIIATVLADDDNGKILVIDTEKESALTYADDFTFVHLPWRPPYDPRELATTIEEAGREYSVVMIDSTSHFWRKKGGTLDIAGGKFTGWADARPAQEDLVDAVLSCGAHVILCVRSKQEHVQEVDPKTGKHVVKKLGMAAQQDDDLEYELNIACELDMKHEIAVSKSRCDAVPVGRTFGAGHAQELAELYRDWLKVGEPPAPQAVVDGLVARIQALPDEQRKACKGEFMATLGKPELMREARVPEAEALVARFEVLARGGSSDGAPAGAVATPSPGSTGGGEPGPGRSEAPSPDGSTAAGEAAAGVRGGASAPASGEVPASAPTSGSTAAEDPPLDAAVDVGGGEPDPPPPAASPDTPTVTVTTAVLYRATGKTSGAAKLAVKRASEACGSTVFEAADIVKDQGLAARVLEQLGGGVWPDVVPWKDRDEDAWSKWNRRCQGKAGPGTKAKPHPRLLDEDQEIYDEQRHAIAYQASRSHRGRGNEVTSWADLTETECLMVEEGLDALAADTAILTFGDTGSPGGWVIEPKRGA